MWCDGDGNGEWIPLDANACSEDDVWGWPYDKPPPVTKWKAVVKSWHLQQMIQLRDALPLPLDVCKIVSDFVPVP